MPISSDIHQDENTDASYHEISEIHAQLAGVSTILQTMNTLSAQHENTVVDIDASSQLSSAIKQVTLGAETDIQMPETMDPLRAKHLPMSFVALAEINMDDSE
ncbi:hypothetical protein DPMN_023950 [Dreissena polymorpha]|uniref:Uncharacterized protein n=1 Tax=Dreissena polymorpha TaxID=45954 RepID=A0A9D4LNN1_DREPO|nr:hypothetical protein DPMN_023950 [Dreissena polymorpha]